MSHTRLPKEILLPDRARRDMQVTKGNRVYSSSVSPEVPHITSNPKVPQCFLKLNTNANKCKANHFV